MSYSAATRRAAVAALARTMLVRLTMRGFSISILFVGALVLNPFFACRDSFAFDLADVERALAGTWHAKVTKDGATTEMSFRIEAGVDAEADKTGARHLVQPAAACAKRSLVKSAAACLDETGVPLVLVALDGTRRMNGSLRIVGTRFERGSMMLELGDATVFAQISSTGEVHDVRATADDAVELTHTP